MSDPTETRILTAARVPLIGLQNRPGLRFIRNERPEGLNLTGMFGENRGKCRN
jgi:hypothetical protein